LILLHKKNSLKQLKVQVMEMEKVD
jgi:hypothetical protein